MSLTAPQKQTVAAWVRDGATLSEVQKRITSEFGVHMTYLDVRFLVDDLDVTLVDKTPPPAPEPAKDSPVPPEEEALPDETPEPAAAPAPGASSLSLTVDPIQRPGVLVGGSVTFSDGKTGSWQMDQYGQLGFVPPEPGYKPSPADVQRFQVVLDSELRKLGY